ncbi:branched-chain amino acid transaminase [Pedobacter gandavensis]|uniref:Branched-chain-amino-acid aminotransferase n=1 Tax=Pedobacter gandavensis TaxID=2679963 RepID=A0ABR6F454_9SPHI|nr:branched-chain amino acid transaminase [Pedobacter gandavensis]MBB2151799.1 branched-chain amino acid transaminase [Pedobacter gandavensis]
MKYFNSNTVLYLDGKFQKAANATAEIYEQSLHYGYAVFEGIRAYQTHNGTRVFKAREHFERLKRSAELVNLPFPWEVNDLIKQTYKLLQLNNLKDAYIRPLVYCAPNMSMVSATEVSIMICAWDWDAYPGNEQLKVGVSSYERPNTKSFPIEAKVTGNDGNATLATMEAKRNGFDEAVLLDSNGNIAEGPGANIFIEKNGKLYTPALGNIFPGITRATVIELCHILDIEIIEKHLSVADLKHADSAFFCGTATEIAGIASIDEYQFPIRWNDSVGATIQRTYKCLVLEKQNYEVII